MSIHLSMSVEDPYTENLLLYLEQQFGSNISRKVTLLHRAEQWLQIGTPAVFNSLDPPAKTVLLVGDHSLCEEPQQPSSKQHESPLA
jgi:hypothetical protein